MSRVSKKKSDIPPKPDVVQRYEMAARRFGKTQAMAQARLERELRTQRCYEQCKYRALGQVLFSDIPQVRGLLLANALLDAMQQAILIANSRVILPEGVKP